MRISKGSVDQIWDYLKELKEKQQAAKEQQKMSEESQKNEFSDKRDATALSAEPSPTPNMDNNKDEKDSSTVKIPSADEVKKAMKKILKNEKDKSMPIKTLRKAVCTKYGLEKKGRKQMKKLLKEHLLGKKFAVDGKLVRLKVD